MGRRKVDKTKLIEDKGLRDTAFCKRRRGIIKKVIEMSSTCAQRIFLVAYDPEKNKAFQFSSDPDFSFSEAYQAVRRIRKSNQPHNFEMYGNEDYDRLDLDLRTLRRNNKPADEVVAERNQDTGLRFFEKGEMTNSEFAKSERGRSGSVRHEGISDKADRAREVSPLELPQNVFNRKYSVP